MAKAHLCIQPVGGTPRPQPASTGMLLAPYSRVFEADKGEALTSFSQRNLQTYVNLLGKQFIKNYGMIYAGNIDTLNLNPKIVINLYPYLHISIHQL